MAALTRTEIRALIIAMLGTSSDDPQFSSTILNPIIQQAANSLYSAIQLANRSYLSTTVTLVPDSTTGHTYTFALQSPAITDFAAWLEVRYGDQDGGALEEGRAESLKDMGVDSFAITGPDDTPVLVTSPDSPAGEDLFFRYAQWPADFSGDTSVPSAIPSRFHDVVALEALFAFGLGGEQRCPPELRERWKDRRAELLTRVGRRGVANSTTRIVEGVE